MSSSHCYVGHNYVGHNYVGHNCVGEFLALPPYPLRRGFARSDDGGETWAQWWWLEDRQPDVYTGTCENSVSSDPAASPDEGRMFYARPGAVNGSRSNYTVHRSYDGGGTWRLQAVVYSHGAGYSDSVVLPNGNLGVVFQRCLYNASIEGGGYNLAFAEVPV